MTLDHAWASDLLDRYATARSAWDGDALVDLHRPDAEWVVEQFQPPVTGHNAIRRRLLEASDLEEQVEFTFERHWVVPPTILAVWHASYVHRQTRARVHVAGFATFEIDDGGLIRRSRFWYNQREVAAE